MQKQNSVSTPVPAMLNNTAEPYTKAPVDALPFSLDYIPEELKIRAKSELSEDEKQIAQKLKLLRSMLKEEEGLHWQDDDLFLLAFLRVKKFDVARAFGIIKGFYSALSRQGHIYYTLNFDFLKSIMEENSFSILPYRDKEGSIIIVFRFTFWDYKAISAEEYLVCISLGLMQALLSPATQIAGVKIIADFKDFSTAHLVHISPNCMISFLRLFQNVVPIRLQAFHIINQNYFFSCVWSVSKYFTPKKVKERLYFHGDNLKSLHDFFSPSILPAELGGDQPPLDNTEWRETMEKSADYIQHVVSFGYEKYLKKFRKVPENTNELKL